MLVAVMFISAVSFAQNTTQEVSKTKKVQVKSKRPPASKELKLIKASPKKQANNPEGTLVPVKAVEKKKKK
jgi:hypothetical protein